MEDTKTYTVKWIASGVVTKLHEFCTKEEAFKYARTLLAIPHTSDIHVYEDNHVHNEVPLEDWNPFVQHPADTDNFTTEYILEYTRTGLEYKHTETPPTFTRSYSTLNEAKRVYDRLEQSGDVTDLTMSMVRKSKMVMREKGASHKAKVFIPIIINTAGGLYDAELTFSMEAAELALNKAWERLPPEDQKTYHKKIQECEIDLWK